MDFICARIFRLWPGAVATLFMTSTGFGTMGSERERKLCTSSPGGHTASRYVTDLEELEG